MPREELDRLSCSDRSQYTYRSQSVPRSLSAAPGRRDVVCPSFVAVSKVMSASLSPLSISKGVLYVVQRRPDRLLVTLQEGQYIVCSAIVVWCSARRCSITPAAAPCVAGDLRNR